jgi:hypothetical protein
MGTDSSTCSGVLTSTPYPSSLAERTLRRQIPKVGARCVKYARRDLCGGCSVMGTPTAIRILRPGKPPLRSSTRQTIAFPERPDERPRRKMARSVDDHALCAALDAFGMLWNLFVDRKVRSNQILPSLIFASDVLPQQPSQKAEKFCRVLNGGFRAVVASTRLSLFVGDLTKSGRFDQKKARQI